MIAFLADLHLMSRTPACRIDPEPFKVVQYKKLKSAIDLMKERGVEDIIIAGDVFHSPRDMDCLEMLMDLITYSEMDWYAVSGQHDMYNRSLNATTSFSILTEYNFVHKLGEDPITLRGYDIYGCSYGEKVPVPESHSRKNILVIHESISDHEKFGKIAQYNATAFLKNYPQYNIIICGDIHATFKTELNGKVIANPGPLFRFEASQHSFEHTPGYFEFGDSLEFVEIPHEPADNVLFRDYIDAKVKKQKRETVDFVKTLQQAKVSRVDPMRAVIEFYQGNPEMLDLIEEARNVR